MRFIREKVLDAIEFTLTSEEMRHTQMHIIEIIVDKASSALLTNQKWVSWVMKQIKTGKLIAQVQEKVSAALAEKIVSAALAEKITKEFLK